MSNQLSIAGAQPSRPVRFAALYQNRAATGAWTQRNPLRDAASTRLEEKFYGARNDGLIDGVNIEISNGLTYIRRPGLSVFNAQIFPRIDGFYQFRIFNSLSETIKVMADTASVLYDATGPSTKTAIWNKSAGSGQTLMQSVGNTLYFGNGVEQKKWVQSAVTWLANTTFNANQFIIDPNGNIQVAFGFAGAAVTTSQAANHTPPPGSPVTQSVIHVNFATALPFAIGEIGTVTGLSGAAAVNGKTFTYVGGTTLSFLVPQIAPYGPSPDSGIAYGGGSGSVMSGVSGSTAPTWATTSGATTTDGTVLWVCKGPQVENWGIATPTTAPTVSQGPVVSPYPTWQTSTFYAPTGLFFDASGTFAILVQDGVTGGSEPTFNHTIGALTADGTAKWKTVDNSWRIVTNYGVGDAVPALVGGSPRIFRCIVAGFSGNSVPPWRDPFGAQVEDGTVVWENAGPQLEWTAIGPTTAITLDSTILDSGGFIQTAVVAGLSGASAPTWIETPSSQTIDNTITWSNIGPFAPGATGSCFYAYSFKNSVTDTVSTASPLSASFLLRVNHSAIVQGPGSPDPQADTVQIFRTTQGQTVLLLLAEIPLLGGSSSLWTYTDTTPDTGLNAEIQAPINHANDPPAVGFQPSAYHLGRIWGMVDNTVYFSNGPDTLDGSGNEAFPPANSFVFPSKATRLWPSSQGLFVFTVSDVYLVQGLGTSASPFFSLPFLTGIGLLNYNAFDVNGTTLYLMTSDRQVVSLDLSSGVSEVGFPIGDQFDKNNWNPATANVTWHIAGSADKGLYVSDNSTGWFRMYPTPAPESGLTWAPFASIQAGCSMVQSVETTPGIHRLLVGPSTTGPILKRDRSVWTDNGASFPANFTIGSIVLAQPGQLAEIAFITTDSIKIGTPPDIYVQLDEIAPFSAGYFDLLSHTIAISDPPQLTASQSMYSQRYWLSYTQKPALGRSLQIRVDWGSDTVQNELLSLTLYGGYSQESFGA